jgi:hypothetical protein
LWHQEDHPYEISSIRRGRRPSVFTFAGGLGLAEAASAAPTKSARPVGGATLTSEIPCTVAGVDQTCTLAVTSLQLIDGVVTAAGTVTGAGVTVPFQAPLVDPPGTCQVLDLTLGPLHLDLLGLVVDLNQVHLTINAQQGPGNLLGNLLCSLTHLLDSNASTNALTNLLNRITQILGGL